MALELYVVLGKQKKDEATLQLDGTSITIPLPSVSIKVSATTRIW